METDGGLCLPDVETKEIIKTSLIESDKRSIVNQETFAIKQELVKELDESSDQCGKKIKIEQNNGEEANCDNGNGDVNVKDQTDNQEKATEVNNDPYAYTKLGGFTCEVFKLEIGNLPKFISYTCLKKMIEKKCSVKPHKIKVIKDRGAKVFSFISFKSAEDRDKVMSIMNGFRWKNHTLFAKFANPAKDPLIAKRMEEVKSTQDEPMDINSPDVGDKLNDKVCPLWRTPYEEQLKVKSDNYAKFLASLRKDIIKLKANGPGKSNQPQENCNEESDDKLDPIKWVQQNAPKFNYAICPMDKIKSSPVTVGYRNKCEFSIGPGKIIGFRLGLYKEGSVTVVSPPENCPIVSPKMKSIISIFQEYLNSSPHDAFNNVTHEGFWRQLTVRATELGSMVIISVHPQEMTKEELEQEKTKIKEFFTSNKDPETVYSLFFHPYTTRDKTIHDQSELQLVDGKPYIFESMKQGALTLKISPFAFFQTNTKAAEVCYQSIIELADLDTDSIVLDICCGTGAIGLYISGQVKHVIGLELNHDALEDAKYNAEINKITNIEFIEGKAEDVIDSVIERAQKKFGDKVVLTAIIDPPRAGLHPSVIKTLRGTANLQKLVYVSCEPNIARKNLIDLSRPTSNLYKGTPFVPTRAIPIDMFPHTAHCELLLLYQRLDIVIDSETDEIPETSTVTSAPPTEAQTLPSEAPLTTIKAESEL